MSALLRFIETRHPMLAYQPQCNAVIYTAADMPKCLRDNTAVTNKTGISNTMMSTSKASGEPLHAAVVLHNAVATEMQGNEIRKRAMTIDASQSDAAPFLGSEDKFET